MNDPQSWIDKNEAHAYDKACEACLQNCYQVLSTAVALKDVAGGEMRFCKCRQTCLETRERVRALTTGLAERAGPGDNADVANRDAL